MPQDDLAQSVRRGRSRLAAHYELRVIVAVNRERRLASDKANDEQGPGPNGEDAPDEDGDHAYEKRARDDEDASGEIGAEAGPYPQLRQVTADGADRPPGGNE